MSTAGADGLVSNREGARYLGVNLDTAHTHGLPTTLYSCWDAASPSSRPAHYPKHRRARTRYSAARCCSSASMKRL